MSSNNYGKYRKLDFLIVFLLLIELIILVFIDNSNKLILLFIIPFEIKCFLDSINQKQIGFIIFHLFSFEMIIAIAIYLYVLNVTEKGWRIEYSNSSIQYTAFKYMLISEIIILISYYLSKYFCIHIETNKKIREIKNSSLVSVICCFILLFLFINVNIFMKRNYAENFNTMASVLLTFSCVLTSILFLYYRNLFNRILFAMHLMVTIILAFNGYRSYLVSICLSIVILYLYKMNQINLRNIIIILSVLGALYLILMFSKSIFTERRIEDFLFGHEINIYYSLCAMIKKTDQSGTVNSYLNTISSILPKAITHNEYKNSGALLMQYVNALAYKKSGISIGTYYLAEAYLSFGIKGIPIISIAISIFFLKLDNLIRYRNNRYYLFIYVYILSRIYSLVYYGSYQFVKFSLYFCLLVGLIRLFDEKKINIKIR